MRQRKPKSKTSVHHRIDTETYAEAVKLNINVSMVIEEILSQLVKVKQCPCCGQKVKDK